MVTSAANPVQDERALAEQLQRERIKAIMENKDKILKAVEEGFGEALEDELGEKMKRGEIKVSVNRIPRLPHYDSPAGPRKKIQLTRRRGLPPGPADELKPAPPETVAHDRPRLVPPEALAEESPPEETTLSEDTEEAPRETMTAEPTPTTVLTSNRTTEPASIAKEGRMPPDAKAPRPARPAEKPPAITTADYHTPTVDQPDQAASQTDRKIQSDTPAPPLSKPASTEESKNKKPTPPPAKEREQAIALKKEKQQAARGPDRQEEASQPPAPAEEEKEEDRIEERSGLTQGINALRYRREIKNIDTQIKQRQKQRLPQARAIAQTQKKIRPLLAAYNSMRLALLILRLIKIPLDIIGSILLVFGAGALLLTIDRVLGVAVRALKKTKNKLARQIVPYRKKIRKARQAIADLDIKIIQLSRQRRMLINTSLLEQRQPQPAAT